MKKRIICILAVLMLLVQVDAAEPTPLESRGLPNVSQRVLGKWDLSADFLAWFVSEEASAVWADLLKVGDNTSSFGVPDLPF